MRQLSIKAVVFSHIKAIEWQICFYYFIICLVLFNAYNASLPVFLFLFLSLFCPFFVPYYFSGYTITNIPKSQSPRNS
ncbi:hypothetical protein F4782DRAFT_285207 [Xylaria castorea]|nr:hypothetical protein F4782DRAFT_285207 [Xylaria castorea]